MVNGCRTTWAFPFSFSYGSALFIRFLLKNPIMAALLYAPVTRQEIPCSTEVGSLPDFLSGNCLFPVDELIISAHDHDCIEAVV